MIGVFDSGLGGLTVVREIWRVNPTVPILYLGDLARLPYGTKSRATICRYAEEDVEFLLKEGAEKIIIACNTVSSLAYDHLISKFQNIVMPEVIPSVDLRRETDSSSAKNILEPQNFDIYEVVTPAARRAAEVSKSGRIGVIGTRATIGSRIYEKKILELRPTAQVFSQAAPLLVSLIEEGWTKHPEIKTILRTYLQPLRNAQIDTLILGCTHFPLIKNEIQHRMGRQVHIIDSAEEVTGALARSLIPSEAEGSFRFRSVIPSEAEGSFRQSKFFITDLTPHWQALAEKWLGKRIKLELVSL